MSGRANLVSGCLHRLQRFKTHERIEEARYCHDRLQQHTDSAPTCLPKSVSKVSGPPLRCPDESGNPASPRRLLLCRNTTVIICLLQKADHQRQAEDVHRKVHPKRYRPTLGLGHEGGKQRTHVWAYDDKRPLQSHGIHQHVFNSPAVQDNLRPNVDFACVLVEEKYVFEKHQATRLADS